MWLPQHTSLSLYPPPTPLAVPPALSMACQKGFYSWRVQTKAAHTPHSLPCSPLPLPRRVAFFRLPGRRAPLGRSCRLGHSASGIRDPASHTCAGLKVMICFISHGNRWQSFRPHTDIPTPKTDPPTSFSPLLERWDLCFLVNKITDMLRDSAWRSLKVNGAWADIRIRPAYSIFIPSVLIGTLPNSLLLLVMRYGNWKLKKRRYTGLSLVNMSYISKLNNVYLG